MSGAGTFRFDLDATVRSISEGLDLQIPISFVGDVQAPDRVRGELVVDLGVFVLEIETVMIGDTTYTTNLQTGRWEIAAGLSSALPNPAQLAEAGAALAGNVILVGEELLDGTPVYHLRGVPRRAMFAESEGEVRADLWIGVEDFLVRQFQAEGPVSLKDIDLPFGEGLVAEVVRLDITVALSEHGRPVTIVAPSVP